MKLKRTLNESPDMRDYYNESIQNLKRVIDSPDSKINAVTELNPVMADAYNNSEKIDKEIEKELKNMKLEKELKKPFLGAKKQPVPKSIKEHLDESLFEDLGHSSEYQSLIDNVISRLELDVENDKISTDDVLETIDSSVTYTDDMWVLAREFLNATDVVHEYDLFQNLFDDVVKELKDREILVEDINKKEPYNAEEEKAFWEIAKKKLSDEDYKDLCNKLGCKDNLSEAVKKGSKLGSRKSTLPRGGKDDPMDDFTRIQEELAPTDNYFIPTYSIFKDIEKHQRYDADMITTTVDHDTVITCDNPDNFDFAKKVASAFELEISEPKKTRQGKYEVIIETGVLA